MEYRRFQTGFYVPVRFRGLTISRYLAAASPLVRFSFHCVLKEGMSFLDIGAGISVTSALFARTPSVRIIVIEPDESLRRVFADEPCFSQADGISGTFRSGFGLRPAEF